MWKSAHLKPLILDDSIYSMHVLPKTKTGNDSNSFTHSLTHLAHSFHSLILVALTPITIKEIQYTKGKVTRNAGQLVIVLKLLLITAMTIAIVIEKGESLFTILPY